MLFEYFNQEGQRVLYTEYPECVLDDYEKGNLSSMNQNGYKFKVDGKTVSYKKLISIAKGETS